MLDGAVHAGALLHGEVHDGRWARRGSWRDINQRLRQLFLVGRQRLVVILDLGGVIVNLRVVLPVVLRVVCGRFVGFRGRPQYLGAGPRP